MITLKTNCDKCAHKNICRYKNNAENDMKKLINMTYGKGPNDDYDWNTMSESRHVNITFECPDYNDKANMAFR